MDVLFVLSIILVLIGLFLLLAKYRIVWGGHRCEGQITGYSQPKPGGIFTLAYNYKIEFQYEGETLERYSAETFSCLRNRDPEKNYMKKVPIFYHPERSEEVVLTGLTGVDWGGIALLVAGLLLCIGTLAI